MSDRVVIPAMFPVTCHTKHVGPGSTFIAIKGQYEDGVHYILQALEKGASQLVVQDDAVIPSDIAHSIKRAAVKINYVANSRAALAQLSAQAAGYPAQNLKIIGITGTKGKTTTTHILAHIMRQAGYKTAFISTVKNVIADTEFPPSLTTPQPDYLHQFLKCCIEQGVEFVVMEVAAQALNLHRVDGITFDGAIFTNFSHEHLEFYTTLEEYFVAKCKLFEQCNKDATVLINCDDENGVRLLNDHPEFLSFGMQQRADFSAEISVQQLDHLTLTVLHNNKKNNFMCPSLPGVFNGYNVLAAVSVSLQLGIEPATIAHGLTTFPGVPGRLARYQLPNGATCVIDYAHNPTSYTAVLSLLRSVTNHLIVVFGAGGDRDVSKRSQMGAVASEIADVIIVTSDNPRMEDPNKIINDIIEGITPQCINKVIRELDREQAIKKAYTLSLSGSIIAILGKGADEYQIVGKRKSYFSEREIIQRLQ